MKLLASCVFLAVAALQCLLALGAANVGLYAPDRYEGIAETCLMPMDFGYCRAKVKRYYFDMRRMKCAMFYFGGCAGNVNNFKSLEECNKVCLDSVEDYEAPVAPVPSSRDPKSRSSGSASVNANANSSASNTTTTSNASYKNAKQNSAKHIENRNDDDAADYDYDEN